MSKNINIDCNNVLTCVKNFHLSNLLLFIGCTKIYDVIYVIRRCSLVLSRMRGKLGSVITHAHMALMTHRDTVVQTCRRRVSVQKFTRTLLFTFDSFLCPSISYRSVYWLYVYMYICHASYICLIHRKSRSVT